MKKAFTLIELLAVIIILAIVALIATPIVLNVIEESKDSANKSIAYNILDAGKLYYTESMLDENKKTDIGTGSNIYDKLVLNGEKPKDGKLYINEQGKVSLSVVIDNKCYVKGYETELTIYDKDALECDAYVGEDNFVPTINYEVVGTKGNDNWYINEFYIKVIPQDIGSGIKSYKWCEGNNCIPINEETSSKSLNYSQKENLVICVIAIDNYGNESELTCSDEYKVDTVAPTLEGIEDIVVSTNTTVSLTEGVTVTDELSGLEGSYTYNPTSVDTTKSGTTEVTYTVKDKAGNITTKTRKVIVSSTAPEITYTVADGVINEYGWAKEDFLVTVNVKDNSGHGIEEIKLCTAEDTCDPTMGSTITNTISTREIFTEGVHRICVQAKDKTGQTSEIICSNTYKLDKTAPTAGTILVNGETPNTNWYNTDLTITPVDGSDDRSGHLSTTVDVTSITSNTDGKVVTVTTTDKSGNTSTRTYTLKMDKTEPTVTVERVSGSAKLKATVTPSTTVSNYTYQWYEVRPGNETAMSGATSSTYTPTIGGMYKVVVTTGTGKTVTSNTVSIDSYAIRYNMNGGSGTIASQEKLIETPITLSTTVPERSGYEFLGWGTSSTDKTATYAPGDAYTADKTVTLYAIWKKTVTINFVSNGATLTGDTTLTCDMYNTENGCSVPAPTITRDGFTILGFNTSASATTKAGPESGGLAIVSENTTYYAITKKVVNVIFYKNGAASLTPNGGDTFTVESIPSSCTIWNLAVDCSITSPAITAPSGYEVIGWNTSTSATTSTWAPSAYKMFSADASYYAITKQKFYTDASGANKPELLDNMIPVKYNGSNWVYADISEEWYNYDNKQWANAVVLNSGVTKTVGQTISESEIALMYVWIPRYTYTIFNGNNGSVSARQINVKFESGTTSSGTTVCENAYFIDGNYISETCTDATNGSIKNGTSTYTHPAFTFGTQQLTGFWVGKFEVSGTIETITIKPNVSSLTNYAIGKFFTAIQNIKSSYNLSGDSHMMKNMEWGAVAYLKQSKYGLGTTDIGINNASATGCGAPAGSEESYTCNAYNTTTGMKASTTGNIYGVYDMSGGNWEYVMGNMMKSSCSFYEYMGAFTTYPSSKYYDEYSYDESSTVDHSRGKLGDATKETLDAYGEAYEGGWNGDITFLVHAKNPWFIRGGYSYNGDYAGIFAFEYATGAADYSNSTRAVLTP